MLISLYVHYKKGKLSFNNKS